MAPAVIRCCPEREPDGIPASHVSAVQVIEWLSGDKLLGGARRLEPWTSVHPISHMRNNGGATPSNGESCRRRYVDYRPGFPEGRRQGKCHMPYTLRHTTKRVNKRIKRVIVTPAVDPRFFEFPHLEIQSTGYKAVEMLWFNIFYLFQIPLVTAGSVVRAPAQ